MPFKICGSKQTDQRLIQLNPKTPLFEIFGALSPLGVWVCLSIFSWHPPHLFWIMPPSAIESLMDLTPVGAAEPFEDSLQLKSLTLKHLGV